MDTGFASKNLTAGQLNAIVKQLGGEKNARRLLKGKVVPCVPVGEGYIPLSALYPVTIGVMGSAEAYREAFRSLPIYKGNPGYETLEFPCARHRTELSLIFLPGEYFRREIKEISTRNIRDGFVHETDLLHVAQKMGLKLCPVEAAAALVLDLASQKRKSYLSVEVATEKFMWGGHHENGGERRLDLHVAGQELSGRWEFYISPSVSQAGIRNSRQLVVFMYSWDV